MNCENQAEEINIYISREDNPTAKFLQLEQNGFEPCQGNSRTGFYTEWVKSTYSDDNETLQQMKNAKVTRYSISHPKRSFDFPVPVELIV